MPRKPIKRNPTPKESQAAVEVQAPIQSQSKAIAKQGAFSQLAKVARSGRALGSATEFVKPEELFQSNYRDGLISPPFYISKAFSFESKNGFGNRLGLEIVFNNHTIVNVAIPLSDGDIKRHQLLAWFQDANSQPIGPVCFQQLDLGRGNPYYDIVPYQSDSVQRVITIPFEDIDEDIPF